MHIAQDVSKRPSPKRNATIGRVSVDDESVDQIEVIQDDATGNLTVKNIADEEVVESREFESTEQLYQGVSTRVPRQQIDDTVQDALLELGFAVIDGDT